MWEKIKYWWNHKHTWVKDGDVYGVSCDMGQWMDYYQNLRCIECGKVMREHPYDAEQRLTAQEK
jgi:hypothetical protein